MGLVKVKYEGRSDQRILSAKDQGLDEGEDLVFAPGTTREIPEELFVKLRGGEPGSWLQVRGGEDDEADEAEDSGESEAEDENEVQSEVLEKPAAEETTRSGRHKR